MERIPLTLTVIVASVVINLVLALFFQGVHKLRTRPVSDREDEAVPPQYFRRYRAVR